MHYYVDGYNLLFRLLGGASKNLKQERRRLITSLEAKADDLSLNVSLIFDAHYRSGDESRLHFYALEIIYTPQGVTADEFILQILKGKQNLKHITIVTSDKVLACHARRAGAHTQSVEEFYSWVQVRYKKRKKKAASLPLKNKIPNGPVQAAQNANRPAPLPLEKTLSEGSLEYYLQIFEKGFENIQSFEVEKRESKALQKGKKSKPPKPKLVEKDEYQGLSELERWLKIFEAKDKNQ